MRISLISLAALAIVGSALPANAQPVPSGWGYVPAPYAPVPYGNTDDRERYADRYQRVSWGDDDDRGREHRDNGRHGGDRRHDDRRDDRRGDARDWQRGGGYNYNRPDPRYNGYYANNYYRGGNYQARRLGANDRIYRGQDNRYYCRRSDGTTGLIIGALGGGVLGNVIAPGGSKTLGSILGGGLGAVLGSSIDRGNVTCR
jgi:hypothetical protein